MAKKAHKYFTTWRRIEPKAAPSSPQSGSRTFEAFSSSGMRSSARVSHRDASSRSAEKIPFRAPIAVFGAVVLILLAIVAFKASGPQQTWAFDRPEAQRSSQVKHTLY
jgi:hypothetical protein